MVEIRKIHIPFALILPVLLSAASCTVKEDRRECPVYVTVLTDRFVQNRLESGTVSFSAGSLLNKEDINYLDYIGKGYTYPCPRDYARTSLISGVVNGKISEGVLYIPVGRPGDRIWAYGETFSVNADEYVSEAVPHKQFCLVKFMFDDSPVAPEGYPWRFRIRAGYSGLNIYTLEPVEGEYACPVGPDNVGEWYGVIPRQRENSMKLEVIRPYEDSMTDGRVDYVIDLGKRFADAGYDWTEEDLKDMIVKVGFTELDVIVSVAPWLDDGSTEVHI